MWREGTHEHHHLKKYATFASNMICMSGQAALIYHHVRIHSPDRRGNGKDRERGGKLRLLRQIVFYKTDKTRTGKKPRGINHRLIK